MTNISFPIILRLLDCLVLYAERFPNSEPTINQSIRSHQSLAQKSRNGFACYELTSKSHQLKDVCGFYSSPNATVLFSKMNKESLSGNGLNYLIPAMSYESIKGNSKCSVWFE